MFFVSIKCQLEKNVTLSLFIHGEVSNFLSFFLFFPVNVFIRHVPYKSSVKINEDLNMKKVSVCVEKTRKDLLKIHFVELRKTICKCSILLNLRIHVKLFFFSISSLSCFKDESPISKIKKVKRLKFQFNI
jgi:hypothetical protein